MSGRNIAASVRARLLNKAREEQRDFSLVLTRYALERLLYRIGISEYADNFLLKGALLFDLWFDVPLRPTRDIDLLGFGLAELPHLIATFEDICSLDVEDGIRFDPKTIQAEEIRKDANYAGIRVTLIGLIDGARCSVQIDVGYGDAVTPAPELAEYPVMLPEFPAPKLRVYPRYTVVAEKLEAMISLGIANSRMKDYFDLWVLASRSDYEGDVLRAAIAATLERRGTPVPADIPFGLTDDFANDPQKRVQWQAFLGKNRLDSRSLHEVIESLRKFVMPPLMNVDQNTAFRMRWVQDKGWC